ncbi:hypothetical protein JCM8202_005482 [Rhodotorula sphaerocarpa]
MQRSIASLARGTAHAARSARPRAPAAAFTAAALSPAITAAARPLPRLQSSPSRSFASTRTASAPDAPGPYSISELTDREYHDVADKTMDRLTEYLEETVEALPGDISDYDVEYSSGVLTVRLGDRGTYVLNKQPPNKQIWLSSPISGPKRYDWDQDHRVWFYHRDGDLLHDLLNRELRELLGDERIEVDLAERDES